MDSRLRCCCCCSAEPIWLLTSCCCSCCSCCCTAAPAACKEEEAPCEQRRGTHLLRNERACSAEQQRRQQLSSAPLPTLMQAMVHLPAPPALSAAPGRVVLRVGCLAAHVRCSAPPAAPRAALAGLTCRTHAAARALLCRTSCRTSCRALVRSSEFTPSPRECGQGVKLRSSCGCVRPFPLPRAGSLARDSPRSGLGCSSRHAGRIRDRVVTRPSPAPGWRRPREASSTGPSGARWTSRPAVERCEGGAWRTQSPARRSIALGSLDRLSCG